ncbi:hypothetical protein E3O55_13015 [Cryobacterium sp. MDB1-18-2]|uniref:WhiB family transcriptional regulator n=1 Tax=unclassified Cryobacterium TaxID=2649013 RepID=UPI00106BCD6C|nr:MULTISPECIES: WhiB family transcriptional regulator [unclassified Cryobacterium]TFC26994.1 hypothetical protein E3O55_13015 [Cryobacterium sp. MDB1-18-2]TFC44186.1 hypothetical protein E3O50_06030 [Cryobacterium sp. MDB1-18-1]
MSRATDAFEALSIAMQDTDPACQADDRFILDDTPPHTLASICRSCPVYDLCAAYGEFDRPPAGIWAGKRYRRNQKKETTS